MKRSIKRHGWHAPSLQRLPERPFRTLPGGIAPAASPSRRRAQTWRSLFVAPCALRKLLCGLSQFPLSFPAKSRWAPRSSGEFRSGHATPPANPHLINKRKATGFQAARRLSFNINLVRIPSLERRPYLHSTARSLSPAHPDRAEKRSLPVARACLTLVLSTHPL